MQGDDLAEHWTVMKTTTKNSFWAIIKMHCMQIDILQKTVANKRGKQHVEGQQPSSYVLVSF